MAFFPGKDGNKIPVKVEYIKREKEDESITLDNIVQRAKKAGSFFVTATVRDKNKEEGDLDHFIIQEDFPADDIIPSIDRAIRGMGIKPKIAPPVKEAPNVKGDEKPLKIAIITHFNRCPDSYSPGKAVKNQIKILREYGHEVVFFTMEGSELNVGCEMRPLVPKFKREKGIINEEAKKRMIDMLREQLTCDFDLAITHDFYIDDCITYREAIKECGVDIPWLHWARSGVGSPIDFKMDNARYVYMNYADSELFAERIGVSHDKVRVAFNEKDPKYMFNWHPITCMVSDKMKLWEKDIIQIYPVCTTRMDAKGMDSVIKIFGVLKEMGQKVALVICNSNGRRRIDEIKNKVKFAGECGLVAGEDIVFTSLLHTEEFNTLTEVPHAVVSQLFQASNLFIFPTLAEVCSNILLEASMTNNLLVLNEDLPSLFDFADEKMVLKHPFTSLRSLHYEGRDKESLSKLAKQIIGQIQSNKADKQLRRVWKKHCKEAIYNKMLAPVLYEGRNKEG